MDEPCPVCGSKLHHAKMKFKNGEEGMFVFCENPDCDYKERRGDKDETKPGPVQEVNILLAS